MIVRAVGYGKIDVHSATINGHYGIDIDDHCMTYRLRVEGAPNLERVPLRHEAPG
jgi:hypothetical protein